MQRHRLPDWGGGVIGHPGLLSSHGGQGEAVGVGESAINLSG